MSNAGFIPRPITWRSARRIADSRRPRRTALSWLSWACAPIVASGGDSTIFSKSSVPIMQTSMRVCSFMNSSLELEGYGPDSGGVRRYRYVGHGRMRCGNPMNLFPAVELSTSHCSQDRGQNHSGAMNPGEDFVQADGTANFGSRNLGCSDGIRSAREIQAC